MTLHPIRLVQSVFFFKSSPHVQHLFTKNVLVKIKRVRKTHKNGKEKEKEEVRARSYTTQSGGQGDTTQLKSKYFHKQDG